MADFQSVAGTTATTANIARRFTYSSDGQSVYVNDAFGTLQNKDVAVLALPKTMVGKPHVLGLLEIGRAHV